MMLRNNKLFSLLLALILVLSLLCGCVDTQPAPTDSTGETAVTTDATDTTGPEQTEPPTESGQDWSVDPYEGMTAEEFYADYTTASCYEDACWRTKHYFLSGSLDVPGQYWETAEDQPMDGSCNNAEIISHLFG